MKGMPLPFDFQGKGVLDLELVVNRTLSSCWNNHNAAAAATTITKANNCFLADTIISTSPGDFEPTSVLDTIRSHSPPTSSSTLSSSLGGNSGGAAAVVGGSGGAASTDTAGVAAVSGNSSTKWHRDAPSTTSSNVAAESELQPLQQSLEMGSAAATGTTAAEKCALEEWESVLPDSVAASPSQEQSILRWIMGDVDDPSMANLNKVLQIGGGGGGHTSADYEFNGGFGVVDQGFGADPSNFMSSMAPISMSNFSGNNRGGNNEKIGFLVNSSGNLGTNNKLSNSQNPIFPSISNNLGGIEFNQAQQQQQLMPQAPPFDSSEIKPHMFNPHVLINQHQTQHPQNPSFFMPLAYGHQEQNLLLPPQAKRHNPGPIGGLEPGCHIPKAPFSDTGQELFMGRQPPPPPPPHQQQLQLLPHYLQQRPAAAVGLKPKMMGEEIGHCQQQQQQQQQQQIIDQLFKAAELVQTGNPLLAQEILARLNHQLSPIGKPFYRAAFYFKEALQSLLHNNNLNSSSAATSSPFSLIFKIGAYKSFSEISPIVQFANFTCNQALLEALEGFDHIHVVDFDIGYGGQWASFMKELTLRTGAAPSLKITAFASPSTHDQLELSLTRENLIHFASEINIAFEFEILSVDSLNSASSWSLPLRVSENDAVAVNLPVSSFSCCQLSFPVVLRFIKQLSPKVVVSVDRGCDRTDLPFPNHVIHALQSYSNLLESLDAVNLNLDSLQKIERFLLHPGIEKVLSSRYFSPEKTQHWRTLFLSSGFSPLTFSNFTESQAAYLVSRTPFHGFQVDKRQSSLVLCWQRKELISASAWRC